MAIRPPRVTSTRRQPTTRGGPRVTSRTQQPTTGRGRLVRQPSMAQVFAPSWGRPIAAPKPAAPSTGVAASAVGAPQYSLTNLPVDASYDAALNTLQRQRSDQLSALVGERSRTLSDYGFQEGPNGVLAPDMNNPFSKSAVMTKTFNTNRRATGQTLAAGGQQYAGSSQNAQDLINRNQLQSEDALSKNVLAFLARNTGQQTEANTGYELAAGQAYGDRVGRFQNNPNYDPATGQWKADEPQPAAAAVAAAAPSTRAAAVAAMRRRARLTGARIGRI